MKLNGKSLNVLATATAIIPRPGKNIELEIQAIPLDFGDRLDEHLPEPKPRYITTGKGNKTKQVADTESDEYRQSLHRNRMRRSALTVRESLKANGDLVFDSDNIDDWAERADGILKEFASAGFSDGDTGILIDQIDVLSNSTSQQLDAAKSLFLSRMTGKGDGQDGHGSQKAMP